MTQPSDQQIFKTILLPFAAYLFTFVGMGLVAGSVVHFGRTDQIPRFLSIGIAGMAMFTISSYIQESRLNGSSIRKGDTLRYVFLSLILAIGIGMISGGTQHFLDFPIYASYLLPLGFVLALIAYVIRNNLTLTRKGWSVLVSGALLLALPTFLGLNLYAQALPAGTGHHGEPPVSVASGHAKSMQQDIRQPKIKSDADFILGMIPHHQEAIETSAYVLTRSDNPELQAFIQKIIEVQATEVRQMKTWYQEWQGEAYQDNGQYEPMMRAMQGTGEVLEMAYMGGMIAHHQEAINMAKQVQNVTARSALKEMTASIISIQSQEASQLQQWLGRGAGSLVSPKPHDAADGHSH